MKICIPTMGDKGMDEQVGAHFGRTLTYTMVDMETGDVQVIRNTTTHMGGTGYAPELIHDNGADVMLCGGLGRKAIQMFHEKDILVYVGATGTVSDAIDMWKAGQLQAATSETACQQHAFQGEGHGDGKHHHCKD